MNAKNANIHNHFKRLLITISGQLRILGLRFTCVSARCPADGKGADGVGPVIDDFVGQGGTLANLIGYVHSQGGVVVGATVSIDREALFSHLII